MLFVIVHRYLSRRRYYSPTVLLQELGDGRSSATVSTWDCLFECGELCTKPCLLVDFTVLGVNTYCIELGLMIELTGPREYGRGS